MSQRDPIDGEMESERQRLEGALKAAERFATAGRLAAGLGHDVNNLLAVMLDLHRQTAGSDPQRQSTLARAESVGEVATSLIRDMLSVARSGLQPPARAPVDLNAVVHTSEALLDCATRKRCQLELRCHDQPLWIPVNALDLQRVLINLVGNAAQAMPLGGRVVIHTCPAEELTGSVLAGAAPGCQAALIVQDSGPGLDGPARARAVRAFVERRLDEEGGMGLAIVAELVRRNGGAIDLWSEPGQGARFTIVLPRAA